MSDTHTAEPSATGRAGARPASEVTALTLEDCWSYLRATKIGRVTIIAAGRPNVFPVNYMVAGQTIVFRTAPGVKLQHGPGSFTCFEVDGYDRSSTEGWSVMAFGRLEDISSATDAASQELRELPVIPAAPGEYRHWIAVRVTEVSGRHFTGGWIVPGGYLG